MESILTVPSGALAEVLAPVGTLFSDTWVLIAIAIGIPLAFYILNKVVGLLRFGS